MKTLITAILAIALLSGCAGMSDQVVTTFTDTAGNVTETIASANTTKTTALYKAHVDVEKENTAMNTNAGLTVDIYGMDSKIVDGRQVFFAKMKITNRPVVSTASNLPQRIPDHWTKEVAISALKYGFYGYAAHQLTEMVSGISSGLTVEGDDNIIQGNQNKAGNNQSIRTDYVTASQEEDGEQFFNNDGECYVDPSFECSCESREKGDC